MQKYHYMYAGDLVVIKMAAKVFSRLAPLLLPLVSVARAQVAPSCSNQCGGSTCADVSQLDCRYLELLGCDCSGCCMIDTDSSSAPKLCGVGSSFNKQFGQEIDLSQLVRRLGA